ncbi:sialate O-acetylesterase [Reichenbachiella agarivorans]|uniref:Sialate O-acetylesterase n=1 Tax=Reichenbachiella agarivorans TaxID=2979464 RepID=A0ABY6CTP6_9BACT|nr:sialate O-acetylesterase [Reichenbachiella agarivorans]UXP33892.1 sialate O-acetylesterase [Reichenbachiella agarivorans]
MLPRIRRFRNVTLLLFASTALISTNGINPKADQGYPLYDNEQEWKANFPKKIDYCEQLPSPDSLYIFLMAGQSNMAGRGFVEPEDTIPNKRILTIDQSMNWIYAKEPLHFYEPKMTGLDCGLSFARALLDSLPEGISVAMIPCAVGGSSIEKWLYNRNHRGVDLLENYKSKVAFAQKYGRVKGILWHQGESNAKIDQIPAYGQKLDSLIAIFRATVANDTLPVFVGELGQYTQPVDKQQRWDALNETIREVANGDSNIYIVETQGLTHKGDYTHLDSESLRELGIRYAQRYLGMNESLQ